MNTRSKSVLAGRVQRSGLFTLALGLAAACGGGGGGSGGSASPSTTDVLIGDAAVDELLAFRTTVTSIVLEDALGMPTPNPLGGYVSVELLGLDTSDLWLTSVDVPPGTYVSATISFVPGSYVALDSFGAPVTVTAVADELTVVFAAPLVITDDSHQRLSIDISLEDSLSGDVGTGMISFDPQGTIAISTDDSPGADSAIDEFKGLVTAEDLADQNFTVDAFVDDDLAVALGSVTVQVSASTLLVDDNGVVLPNVGAFFAAISSALSVVEVHGVLKADGFVSATKVEIEDNAGGSGLDDDIKIEGLVIGKDVASFELLIVEIEKGFALADPVLAMLGDPTSIQVGVDGSTKLYVSSSTPTTFDALAVGQQVDVKFSSTTFMAEPFPALKIEIEDGDPQFEGTLTDVAGLPSSIVVQLQDGDPAVLSGDVASSSTDVTIFIGAATLLLGTDGDPALAAEDLVAGVRVEIEGTLAGTPAAPEITASKVKLEAGEGEGVVTAVGSGGSTLTVQFASVDDPFGGAGISGSGSQFALAPGAVVSGDASSAAGIAALFAGLGAGESLAFEAEGLGTEFVDELVAYAVKVEVVVN